MRLTGPNRPTPTPVAEDRPPVLLFFGEPANNHRQAALTHHLKDVLRPFYRRLRNQPTVTGFHVAYRSLLTALRSSGHVVRVNDYALARRNPDYPVGIIGYPGILDDWRLQNPAVLGPGLYDHPSIRPDLMRDSRFRYYIVPCQWMMDLFAPYYGQTCVYWHAGVDTRDWPDTTGDRKDLDLIVYDKIHWNRDRLEPELIEPILAAMHRRSLTYEVLRYGNYRYPQWRDLLRRSRALLFLSEHETQGIAYQEAMASGLPVLAWDQGWWLDPNRERYTDEPVPVSSVPFFSSDCGERFTSSSEFEVKLEAFLGGIRLGSYKPRAYVQRELSPDGSADVYMQYYRSLLPRGANSVLV